MQLRCPNKLHGVMVESDTLEVVCRSSFCGAGKGIVVLHRFNTTTGHLVQTKTFQDPLKEESNGIN